MSSSAENNPPESFLFKNARLLERMRELDQLPRRPPGYGLRVLDTGITGHELETLNERLRRS